MHWTDLSKYFRCLLKILVSLIILELYFQSFWNRFWLIYPIIILAIWNLDQDFVLSKSSFLLWIMDCTIFFIYVSWGNQFLIWGNSFTVSRLKAKKVQFNKLSAYCTLSSPSHYTDLTWIKDVHTQSLCSEIGKMSTVQYTHYLL